MADWSSLNNDLLRLIADCLLTDNDINYYMNLQAICRNWHRCTNDPIQANGGRDPRFQPKKWAMLKRHGHPRGRYPISRVNLHTGCTLIKSMPMFETDNYFFFNATEAASSSSGNRIWASTRAGGTTLMGLAFSIPSRVSRSAS
jgi:hypothetical protein